MLSFAKRWHLLSCMESMGTTALGWLGLIRWNVVCQACGQVFIHSRIRLNPLWSIFFEPHWNVHVGPGGQKPASLVMLHLLYHLRWHASDINPFLLPTLEAALSFCFSGINYNKKVYGLAFIFCMLTWWDSSHSWFKPGFFYPSSLIPAVQSTLIPGTCAGQEAWFGD